MTVTTAFPSLEVLQQEVLMAYHLHVSRIQKWIKYLMDTGMELCSNKVTQIDCDEIGSKRSRKVTGGLQAAGSRMIITAMRLSREELTSAMYIAKFRAEMLMKSGKPLARGDEKSFTEAAEASRDSLVSAVKEASYAADAAEQAAASTTENTPVRAASSEQEEALPEALAREAAAVFASETQPQTKQNRRRELAAELAKTNLL